MSEPVLRRSGRNAAKKDLPASQPTAPATKKRPAAETKKPAAKKAKTAVDKAGTATKAVVAKTTETAASPKTASAPGKGEGAGQAKSAAKPSTKATTVKAAPKSAIKVAKAKKADQNNEGFKDGDFLPKDLPEVQTEVGSKVTISGLLETAQKGIVIFAYPRASTQGCTTQACLFRDNFSAFSEAGYTIYGLSGDTPASNERFKIKQNLTYTLLCDPTYELHEKFAIKKKPKGTIRSVIIIEKTAENGYSGKILRSSPASPQISLHIAKEVVGIDHASIIAAAAEAKEAEKTAKDEMTLPVGGAGPVVMFT